MNEMVPPRVVPDRDTKYMGLAWMYAAFSKDPSTQVGSCIVSPDNYVLGLGYNGPPRIIEDDSFSWERPKNLDVFNKYDIIVHAEINAIDHSESADLHDATIYVTAMPCPRCMLEIVRKEIKRVVYFDFQSSKNSSLQNASWREKSIELAGRSKTEFVKFSGNLNWIPDWNMKLKDLGVFA